MTNKQVLLMILTFVALTLGSFIWYIATWDADERSYLHIPIQSERATA